MSKYDINIQNTQPLAIRVKQIRANREAQKHCSEEVQINIPTHVHSSGNFHKQLGLGQVVLSRVCLACAKAINFLTSHSLTLRLALSKNMDDVLLKTSKYKEYE